MSKLAMLGGLAVAFMPEILVELLYPKRDTYRGQMINAKAYAVGQLANLIRTPGTLPSVAESREQMAKTVRLLDKKAPALARVEDLTVEGAKGRIAARLYCAESSLTEAKPALVFFHGGGFIQGDINSHNELCAKLAAWWDGIVVSIDYRLAPEHAYPAGVDDCTSAYLWLYENAKRLGIDASRMGVGGDSAGGCFAAVVAQQIKRGGGPMPWFQLLIYPVTDGRMQSTSIEELADAYVLTKQRMCWYRDLYAGDFRDFDDPKFSPLLAEDFKGLPDTYIITGGFDPLMDDGAAYGDKLSEAGVNVTHRHFPGQVHAFLNLTKVVPEGTLALEEVAAWLRDKNLHSRNMHRINTTV